MEFPFGHHRTHHRQEEEEEEQYPPPPHHPTRPDYIREEELRTEYPVTHQHQRPDFYTQEGGGEEGYNENSYQRPPPPPQQQSTYNYSDFPEESPNYPPPYEPQPGYSSVQHVSHEVSPEFEPEPPEFQPEGHHHRHNPFSSVFHHHTHESSEVSRKETVRVFCRAESNYSLSIRDGKVVLARADPDDESQHWYKDEKYSTRVKDEESFPSFALVNKATGQALKHSIGATHPVQLIPYNPDILDESVLWTESKDTGDGFRAIRMVNNIRLNFDAFHGDKDHGGVHDGTTLVLWEWAKGDNQKWKIVPY